jgi:hypothetical protein
MPEQKKRVWITRDDVHMNWIHAERPKACGNSFWLNANYFTALGDKAVEILGLDIKPNELIEIEVTIKKRVTLSRKKKGDNEVA